MNDLKIFENKDIGSIRTVIIDDKPYFVGKDVTDILGYSNSSKALTDHVDDDDKLNNETLSSLGQRGGWLINESGLYSLIMSSNLPKAKEFKKWVTADVLPAIRQTGAYMTKETLEKVLYDPDIIIGIANQLKTLQTEIALKNQLIGELQPKANYVDVILNNNGLVTVTQIAKDYGMSGKKMNELLKKYGIQYKSGEQWLLYSKYHNMGYTHSKTIPIVRSNGMPDIKMETRWTQKGRLFIYEILKKNDVLPVVEREVAV